MDHVLGYTAGNDVTLRDIQQTDRQWSRAKGFDTSCPLGPWIETELDVDDVGIRSWVDGDKKQDGTTADFIFDIPTLIAHLSETITLLPGDVILTGTPAGVGQIVAGNRVDIAIDGLGVLRPRSWKPEPGPASAKHHPPRQNTARLAPPRAPQTHTAHTTEGQS